MIKFYIFTHSFTSEKVSSLTHDNISVKVISTNHKISQVRGVLTGMKEIAKLSRSAAQPLSRSAARLHYAFNQVTTFTQE